MKQYAKFQNRQNAINDVKLQGKIAAMHGKSETDNPHKNPTSEFYQAWIAGYELYKHSLNNTG